jgi:protein TonB
VPSLVGVVALHVAALTALLQYQSVQDAIASATPIMVSFITPEAEREKPKVEPPPPPRPVRKRREPAPVITAPVEAPSPVAAPPAPPEPTVEAPPPVVAAPPAPAPAPPAPIVPPSFLADYLHNPAPPYPASARRIGEQGRVVLRVLVNAEGQPEQVELGTSSGSPRLDGSALETVRRWKFVPARQGERPVAAWVLVPISFRLEG